MSPPTILLASDFSASAEGALAHARALAERLEAGILLCHVAEPEILPSDEESLRELRRGVLARRLEALRETIRAGAGEGAAVPVETVVVEAPLPAAAIAELGRERNAAVIVLGTHGRGGLARFLLGSVAETVIRLAPCPVLTAKSGEGSGGYRHVLLPSDFSSGSHEALGLAAQLAGAFGARLSLLHVAPGRGAATAAVGPAPRSAAPPDPERFAVELDRMAAALPIAAEAFVRSGDSVHEISRFALEKGVDCVVLATHARDALGALLGSVAAGVLREVACAVLTCRPPGGCRLPLPGPRRAEARS